MVRPYWHPCGSYWRPFLPPQESKITKAVRLWTGKTSEAVFRAWRQFTEQAVASGHHADGYYVLQAW